MRKKSNFFIFFKKPYFLWTMLRFRNAPESFEGRRLGLPVSGEWKNVKI